MLKSILVKQNFLTFYWLVAVPPTSQKTHLKILVNWYGFKPGNFFVNQDSDWRYHSFTLSPQNFLISPQIVINDRPLKLLEEAINGINIDNCDHPCVNQPCLNGGRCVPIREFYKCSCPLGFENTICEDRECHLSYFKSSSLKFEWYEWVRMLLRRSVCWDSLLKLNSMNECECYFRRSVC